MDRAPQVLALVGDETGCSMWRVWQPFEELTRHGYIAEWCPKDDAGMVLPMVASGRYDAVITPRIVWPVEGVGERWLNSIHRAGLAWIYEVDDDVFTSRITDRQARLFESERDKGYDQLEWERQQRIKLLAQADGVTVSSKRLATIVRNVAPEQTPVYHIPNAIDAAMWKWLLRGYSRLPELEGKLTIGWSGGTRDEIDLKVLAEAWGVVAARYPDVHFVVQGYVTETLASAVPPHRRSTLPWLQLGEYPRAFLNFDIGCCTVAPLLFNTSKTAIKWYEFTLGGAVCVVSPTVYGREVTHGVNAFVADTVEDWVTSLSALIESEELRRRLYREARRAVLSEHSLANNWWRWPEAWTDAIDRFRERQARTLVLAR